MRVSIAITLILVSTACTTPRDYVQLTDQVGEYGLQVIPDSPHGVRCYVYRDGDNSSLSCVGVPK